MKMLTTRSNAILLRKSLTTFSRWFSKTLEGGSLQPKTIPTSTEVERCLGQPTPYTHKHLLQPGEITPGISKNEYKNRRYQLMSLIKQFDQNKKANHAVVVLASSTKYMADEVPYPFKQNSDFLYLCGLQEPDSVLLLESIPGRELPEHKSTLFVAKQTAKDELWSGPKTEIDGALEFIGVDEAYHVENFCQALDNLSRRKNLMVWYDHFNLDRSNSKHVTNHLVVPCSSKWGSSVNVLEKSMHDLRAIKSPAECRLLQESASITSEAFKEVMKFSCPGINESALYARIDYETRVRGAEFLAYLPVVAGGNRANTIHYITNNQVINGDEIVLMDAGCEYHGYASDITRTWPVSGRFTSAQAELYDAVLSVQKDCVDMCCVGKTLDQIYYFMLMELGKRLVDLGILSRKLSSSELTQRAKDYCPHHVGHYLGMDVHDTGSVSRSRQLQPGMVVTIEPGLYVPLTNTEAPPKYRGMGIRIEDNILITAEEPRNLSEECPKEIDDIESLMAR